MSGNRVNQAIPSFINGVSQQPPTVRLATQCEILENGLPTVSDGLRKRPPREHLAKLWSGSHENSFIHPINRDVHERYLVSINDGDLKVVDLLDNGREIPVSFPDGKDYLASSLPREGFSAVTIADYTFVVNRGVVVRMDPEETPPPANEALVYVKGGYTQTTYQVVVDGETASHTTAGSSEQPNTQNIAQALKTALEGLNIGLLVDRKGSVLWVRKEGGEDFTFSVTDSWGEQALVGIKRQVVKDTDLPAKAFDGFKVRVTGESISPDDDCYYQYNSDGGTRNGSWDECRGWSVKSKFDRATMPHTLVREADGTFTFRRGDWTAATVGDDDSCPPPAFVDKRVAKVFFHRNRLGIIAGENTVLSRDADFFNFWPRTASTVVDTDPIDYAASHEEVSLIRHAVPYRDALLLFADQVQFQLTNGTAPAFGPETVRMDIATQYACSPDCCPIAVGQNIYFAVEHKDNTAIMEYFVTVDGVTLDAIDVTSHAPRYLPKGVFKLVGSTNDDYLLAISSAVRNRLWLYKFFWISEDKVQSAWSEWIFPEGDCILSVANIGPDVYLVIQRDDGVYLEHVNLQTTEPDPGMIFKVHLDRRAWVDGVYDPGTGRTSWTLPYPAEGLDLSLVLGGGFPGRAGQELKPEVVGNVAVIAGRFDQAPCLCGFQYVHRIRLSEQFVRESKDVAAPVVSGGRLQLLSFTVLHRNSGYFRSEVRAKGREVAIARHLGVIGDGNFRIGQPVIDSNKHSFMVLARSDQVTIDIVNDRHFPSNLLSAEWDGLFSLDARRL